MWKSRHSLIILNPKWDNKKPIVQFLLFRILNELKYGKSEERGRPKFFPEDVNEM